MEKYSAVVLAGGRATRLGGLNKAQLEIGGKRLLDRVLDALRPLTDQILVSDHQDLVGEGTKSVQHPIQAPLAPYLQLGLVEAAQSSRSATGQHNGAVLLHLKP